MTWKRKPCGCVKTTLRSTGPVTIRCLSHRGKPAKKGRTLAHFEDVNGTLMVRRG